ncbi:zinc transporter ZupT [Candidatus Margulisiibacteriota bacterium]
MNIGLGLLFSVLAGLSTMIGGLISIFFKPDKKFMTLSLGFSAGVMILVAFVELLQSGIQSIGFLPANIAFFLGMAVMFLIDANIPHDYMAEHNLNAPICRNRNLCRTGFFVALGIAIHNFPEGIAVFAGTLQDINLGIALAVAIALHNIPEGIAVSVPIYAATKSKKKAFWWSFLSGSAEPVGAGIAAIFLIPFLNEAVLGFVLAAVAGVMVFISIDELVPVSRTYGEEHLSIVGFMAGMAIMAISLWMMGAV